MAWWDFQERARLILPNEGGGIAYSVRPTGHYEHPFGIFALPDGLNRVRESARGIGLRSDMDYAAYHARYVFHALLSTVSAYRSKPTLWPEGDTEAEFGEAAKILPARVPFELAA